MLRPRVAEDHLDAIRNGVGHLGLNGQCVAGGIVIVARPMRGLVASGNQPGGDADAIRVVPDRTLNDVVGVQFSRDLSDAFVRIAELHGGGAGDHSNLVGIAVAKLENGLLSEAFSKLISWLVAAEILKGKDSDHRTVPR